MYHSKDLEACARELNPQKSSLLLLNKADLLGHAQRAAWADYFDNNGIQYVFWSAKAAAEGMAGGQSCSSLRLTCISEEKMLYQF